MKSKRVELWKLFDTGQAKGQSFDEIAKAAEAIGFSREETKREHDLFASKAVKMQRKIW